MAEAILFAAPLDLQVVALELGCKPITTDIRKTKEPTRADYSRGILHWVGLFSFLLCCPICS